MLNALQQLDYGRLAKEARRLEPRPDWTPLSIALLGDCALQQITPLVKAVLAHASVRAEVYEAEYDTADNEVYNPASALYASNPQVVVFFDAVHPIKDLFFASENRESFADRIVERIVSRWSAVQRHCGAAIIQNNLVVPYERSFGNYGRKLPDSLENTIDGINRTIAERARAEKAVFVSDIDSLAGYVGRRIWFDEKLWVLSKSYCSFECLPAVVKNIADIALATRGAGVKCVVVDLDNTLWGGVIGDDGLEGIRLGHLGEGEAFVSFQRFLIDLTRRGIVLTVCSKNNHENAILPFREHPEMVLREEHITMFVANWDDKAKNIQLIKETLNIGYDSMVFLDDNPFERNLVRQLLPEVIVPELPEDPALYVKSLCELNLFETASFSSLDAQRTSLYKSAAQREETKRDFASLDDYLASLEMQIEIRRFNDFDLPRIAQLMQRSNQFNLATRRYPESECGAFMRDEAGFYPFSVSLRDRFGDYGLISVVVVRFADDAAMIDEYLMSCRVLQRGVEQYVMNHIFEVVGARGLKRVEGIYIPTKKNGMVREFYKQFGFDPIGSAPEADRWSLRVDRYVPTATHLAPFATGAHEQA
jgi:FkbH-like protein